jgi:hypothetical protein
MLQEIPPTDRANTRAQRSKLDDVITTCRDSAITFRLAAAIPSAHRAELMAISRRRSSFAHRVSGFMPEPDDSNVRGSLGGLASRFVVKARAALLGQTHLGDSLAACLRADAKVTRSYERALDLDWDGDVGDVLEQQCDELEGSSTRVRALRGQL